MYRATAFPQPQPRCIARLRRRGEASQGRRKASGCRLLLRARHPEACSGGVPAENVYGLDVERRFIDLGYDLFRDRKTLASKFIVADVSDQGRISANWGKMDVFFLSSFLHLWNWKDQVKVLQRLLSLAEDRKGTLFLGRQLGTPVSGEFPLQGPSSLLIGHNLESFDRLWQQVGQETGTRWHVEASLYMAPEVSGNRGQSWADPEHANASIQCCPRIELTWVMNGAKYYLP